jgi:uncharacterized membrane protein YfcA
MMVNEILLLLGSGVIVGIINTLGGGGSIITMSLFQAMGMPIEVANITNRVPVVMQNFSATVSFMRKRMVDFRNGFLLSIPAILGTIAGTVVALQVDEMTFKICLSVVLAIILLYLILDKENNPHIHEGHSLTLKWWHYILFFLVGFYGGYIYIGIGYLILAVTLWVMRMDLVTANAIKGFVILLATPFSLAVFMIMGNVDYTFGIVHGVGNMVGSFIASHYMANWGKNFIKIFMAVIVGICFADLVGVISLHDIFYSMLSIKE